MLVRILLLIEREKMRHGSSNRRQRSRGGQGRRSNNKNQVFDSNGPDVRIRGTAFQVAEKYMALAKDSLSSGDDILAQSYLQHAEHYQRIINSWVENEPTPSSDVSEASNKEEKEAVVSKKDISESDDDLSLPASIIAKDAEVKNEELENV